MDEKGNVKKLPIPLSKVFETFLFGESYWMGVWWQRG
jgi:hypothetical protein